MTLTKIEQKFFEEKLKSLHDEIMAIFESKIDHNEQLTHRNNAIHIIEKIQAVIEN